MRNRTRRSQALEVLVFVCSLAVVIVSVMTMEGTRSMAQLIGLIAGSFAAGATLTNMIRDRSGRSGSGT